MSMQGPSNLSKAFTSMTEQTTRTKKQRHSFNIEGFRLTCRMYERSKNSTKRTQAFDASNSIGWCSSGLVRDKRQLPKVLAPWARRNIYLLFLLVFFRLVIKRKTRVRYHKKNPEAFYLFFFKNNSISHHTWSAYPAPFHGDSNLTRLYNVEAIGQIPLQQTALMPLKSGRHKSEQCGVY